MKKSATNNPKKEIVITHRHPEISQEEKDRIVYQVAMAFLSIKAYKPKEEQNLST